MCRCNERISTLTPQPNRGGAARRPAKGEALPVGKSSPPLLSTVLGCLEDAKAEDVVSIDIADKTPIADQMVIASGRSQRHVGAIADQLLDAVKQAGYRDLRVEGLPACDWVLIDSGDVVVHVFRPEVRSFYNLEKLWSADAPLESVAV